MKEETFKEIDYYGCIYSVGTNGTVYIVKDGIKILKKQNVDNRGYVRISISKNGKHTSIGIHQIVAIAFLNHEINGHERVVDHIDDNKLNNNLSNLQILSNAENIRKTRKKKSKGKRTVGVHYHKISNSFLVYLDIIDGHTNKPSIKKAGVFKNGIDAYLFYKSKISD